MHEAYLNKKARLKSVQLPQSVQILHENPKLLVERVLKVRKNFKLPLKSENFLQKKYFFANLALRK